METEELLRCENCHAMIPKDSARCPYCGSLNPIGGEKQYMERLSDLKEDVKDLHGEPVRAYGRELRRTVKVIVITFLCLLTVLLLFLLIRSLIDRESMQEYDSKERLMWERENFPLLDEMYEQGDYDGILAFKGENSDDINHSIGGWEHSDLIDVYMWYKWFMEDADSYSRGNTDTHLIENCILDIFIILQERTYARYDEKELALVEVWQDEMFEAAGDRFGITKETLYQLYENSLVETDYGSRYDYRRGEKNVRTYLKESGLYD